MFNEDDRKWLYDQFKSNGYDTGSYEDFTNSLNNDEDFKWWHEQATGLGLEVGDINEFDSLFRGAPSEDKEKNIAEGRAMFDANRPVQGQRVEEVATMAPSRSTTETEQVKQTEQVEQPVSSPEERQALVDNIAVAYETYKPIVDEYEARWNEYQNDTDNELSGPEVDAKKQWLDDNNAQYRAAKEAISEAEGRLNLYDKPKDLERIQSKKAEARKYMDPTVIVARGITPFGRDNTWKKNKTATDFSEFNVANDIYNMAEQTINQGSKYDPGYEGGWLDKVWTAAKQFAEGGINNFDEGSLTFGLSEGKALTTARRVGEKYNKIVSDTLKELGYSDEDFDKLLDSLRNGGEGAEKYLAIMSEVDSAIENGLSDGEKAILDALDEYTNAQMKRAGDVSVASAAGAGAEQSAEFMLDFILTGGLGKSGTKAAAKIAANRILKKVVGEKGAKVAAKGLADAGVAAARTAIMFPRSLQSYGENLTQIVGKDELGRYNFDRNHLNAALNTALTQYIEYWTEGFGEYLGAIEQKAFKGITKAAPKVAIGKTLNQYRGNIGKYLDYGKFDGMFNEMMEEVAGSSLNALAGWLSGDRVGDKDAMKDFFSGEQLATLALSFLPMSAISARTNLKAYNRMKERYNNAVETLNPLIARGAINSQELNELVSTMSEKTPEEIKDKFVEIADKARKANGSQLPQNFSQSLMGYLEGSFAMQMENETWENSKEKISVVDSYSETYNNPYEFNAWDLAQAEDKARIAALNAGFDEDTLNSDAYILAMKANGISETSPGEAQILLDYADAKAARSGMRDGVSSLFKQQFQRNEQAVRDYLSVKGNIVRAQLGNEGVFVVSDDATVKPDGAIETPTGADGLIQYRTEANGPVLTAKADQFSGAFVTPTDEFIQSDYDMKADALRKSYQQAENTISPEGMSQAIMSNIGQDVFVTDGKGVYQPIKLERMTRGGNDVVISGDKNFLQGLATSMGMHVPATNQIEVPVVSLYGMLAKEDDGSLSTQQPQGQGEETVEPAAPTVEQPQNGELSIDGRPVEFGRMVGDYVEFIYKDDPDQMIQLMEPEEFKEKTGFDPTAGSQAETIEEPVVQEPEPEPVAETEPVQQVDGAIPVDEKTGEPIYDHPDVQPIQAYDDLYGKLSQKNADKFVIGQYDAVRKAYEKAQADIAAGEAEKGKVDNLDIKAGEGINAFIKRQEEARAKIDEKITKAQAELQELQRKVDFWGELREVAQQNIQMRERAAKVDFAPQSLEEATADALTRFFNSGGRLNYKDVIGVTGLDDASLKKQGWKYVLSNDGISIDNFVHNILSGDPNYGSFVTDEQDAINLVGDLLRSFSRAQVGKMIEENRAEEKARMDAEAEARAQYEQQNEGTTDEDIPASEAAEEAPEGTDMTEVEEPVSEPAEPDVTTDEDEDMPEGEQVPVEKTEVKQHPGSLREAYESGDAKRIADAEKAMADFINSSDSVVLLRGTESLEARRRKEAKKDSAEYKLHDFILKAIKNRLSKIDKAEVKAFDEARKVYEDRFTAEKSELQKAIDYFEKEKSTAQSLLDNVTDEADELYVNNLKNRINSAQRYINALGVEMKRFEEEEENQPNASEAAQEEQPQQTEESAPAEESSTPKEPEKPKTAKSKTDEKIDDFGEKIGGARKDMYRSKIRDSVKLTAKDLKELKDPDKILSRKQIIKSMKEGQMTKQDAISLLALNMAVRSTSDSLGMKTLALMKYRDMAAEWEKGDDLTFDITDKDIDFLVDQLSDRVKALPNIREKERASLEALFKKVYEDYKETYEALDYPAVNRSLKSAYIRPGSADGRFWVVGSPSSYRGYPFGNMLEAVAKMQQLYPEVQEAEAKNSNQEEGEKDKFGNLTVTKDENGWYRIKSRSIPGKIYLSKKFYSRKQAEEFLKDNAPALVDREQKMVDALLGSNIGMVNRQGRDYRNGRDVTPDQMLETFGFRGVEFGNWVPQAERQEYLNKTYDAIMDFCDIVGISPKAFSLGGRLGLAFGARGHSRALAHYEPMKEVINLTRMKGAGSLAHEWFHALDNYLAKQKTGNISDMATSTKDTVREETAKAFRDFVSAMDKLDYSKRSRRAGDYWGEVWERAARLFESYVYNELAPKSVTSPLLVRKDSLFDDSISDENVMSAWPYPSIAENEQMKPFFDNLFQTIEERVQEDGKVALAGLNSTTSDVQSEDEVRTYTPTVPEVNHAEYQKRLDEVAEKMNGVAHNSSEYKELIKRQEEILSEYQDAIDPKHVQTSFRTYDQLEDYFLSIGMSETSAKTNADYMRDNDAYGAYMRGRMVFVNEKNTNLEAFRDHYVHERQHHLNERGGIDKKLFDKVGGDLDMLESALSKFVGTSHAATYRFYYQLNNQPEAIADEVIAYAMGLAYYEPAFANDPKFSQLAKEIQDFINDQVNEQFEDSYRPAIQGQRYQYLNDRGRRSSGAQTSEGESGGVSDGSRRNDEGIEGDQTPRFGLETDPDVLAKLESGKKVKVYRAMQLIDGKLYPPMSAKVDGKLREPIELGKWEVAEERPELADKDGNFVLNKGNGSSLKAKYNPYFHTSRSPLNDQFTSAYNRPNLVTVEVEVPESELTSGYKAKNAKDAVGEMTWHSGPVSSKLPDGKKRKVILSRWDKPIRVVPDAEVADRIAEMLEGENISIPYNTVTPSLRRELEKRDVPVSNNPSGTVKESNLLFRPAYHGSPADFEAFDISHIGEGEGAQAHGWGHYVALNRETSAGYANRLFNTDRKATSAINDAIFRIGRKKQDFVDKYVESNYTGDEPLVVESEEKLREARERQQDAFKKYSEALQPYKDKYSAGEMNQQEYWEATMSKDNNLVNLYSEYNTARAELDRATENHYYAVLSVKNHLGNEAKDTEEYAKLRADEPRLYNLRRLSESAVRPKNIPMDVSEKDAEALLYASEFIKQYGWDRAREFDKEPSFAMARDEHKRAIELIKDSDKKDWEFSRNLYTVDIPDDDGFNYISERGELSKEQRNRIAEALRSLPESAWRENDPELFGEPTAAQLANELSKRLINGYEIYAELTRGLGSKKAASEFLHDAGFVGIKYNGGQDGPCAVIFSDDDMKIVEHNKYRENPETEPRQRIAEAELEATNSILDAMSQELGIKINRVGRDQMPAGHKTEKGYYDTETGEITICMDNVTDERDAIATVYHEAVGHHGLRKLFGPRFREAMAGVYAALDSKGRAWVNSYIANHPGSDNVLAVEEYLSYIAESGDFKKSTWDKIKELFGRIIDKLFGTDGFVFTDNELNYILRASYEHLKNPNWQSTVEGKAKDTLMKYQLGINETDPNKPTDPEGPGTGRLYRSGFTGVANEDYNSEMESRWNALVTENQNADLPVKIGMDKVMKEVGKDKLEENEDYLTRHNLSSSRAESEAHEFELFRFEPMLEQVRAIRDKLIGGKSARENREQAYQRVLDYLYAVSGLERNAYKNNEIEQAKQDALVGVTDPAEIAAIEKQYEDMKRDWSGLTSLMGESPDNWRFAEVKARAMIAAFKTEVGDDAALDELWNRIRSCTDFSLEHAYKHGLLTRDEFEKLHGTASQPRMWEYYLPLRGFSETTAEEQFGYDTFANPSTNSFVVKKMNGRWTEADNPLANIRNIAQAEIVQGNDNWAKQALYRFVLNAGENSLLTEVEPWYVKDPATGKWSTAEPYSGESLEDFEKRMQQNRAIEPNNYKKGRRGLKLDSILANKAHQNEHMIRLKVGGIDKMIWVNGNPALAKAVTGRGRAQSMEWIRRASRALSNLFTTYSLDFTAKNLLRDTIYSRIALLVKEDNAYRFQYIKNWYSNFGYGAFAFPMVSLAAQWENGKLVEKEMAGTITRREQMFLDFMRDGGQTGYTIVNSVSQIKKDIDRSMRRAGSASHTFPVFGHYAKAVKTLNEAFELLTRFTAYETSRDMGRSGQRSASDAKEISVNFNRRGAQSGQGFWGALASYLGATHYFYNAGVQGFENFLRLFKTGPVKMSAITAGFVMMGMMTPMINAMLAGLLSGGGDGDDDETKSTDWYWQLPEWVRRNNLILGTGKWYLAIPLPVEFRAPYGIGDITGSAFLFEKTPNRTFGNVAGDLISTAANILPVNPVEGYNGNIGDAALRAVAPDAGMFFVDWATNRDYTGRPLWKENPFSNTVPRSQGAYASTPKGIVLASQKLAQVTNGAIDIAPGLVRDAMNNYGGGFFRAAEDVSKIMFGLFDNDPDRPARWDNIPFFSGFSGHIDEDRSDSFATNALYEYKGVSDEVVKSLNAVLVTDEVTAAIAYDNPDALYEMAQSVYQKAKVKNILSSKDYELGKVYRDGMNNEYVMKQRMRNDYKNGHYAGEWYKSREVKQKGVETLRKEWREAREKWAALPDKTDEEKAIKADAYKDVTNAWHLYYDAKANLVDRLMAIEFNHRIDESNIE